MSLAVQTAGWQFVMKMVHLEDGHIEITVFRKLRMHFYMSSCMMTGAMFLVIVVLAAHINSIEWGYVKSSSFDTL